jgi:hypothetical protein
MTTEPLTPGVDTERAFTHGSTVEARTEALTPCENPLCGNQAKRKGRFCSSRCRLDVWAIKRAAVLLDRVGVVEAFQILSKLGRG